LSDRLSLGCVVPNQLRSRWSVQLGNSLEMLPRMTNQIGPLSIFVHDSLHTYHHMISEFRLGYDALKSGGLMISDDTSYNSAWSDFCKSKNEDWTSISKGQHTSEMFSFLIKGGFQTF